MLEVRNLSHDYEGIGKLAVNDVSFSVPEGNIFGFLGPSGAGKSTVQNILIGLLPIQKGEVTYAGKSIRDLDAGFFNQLGVSFEHPNVYGRLTGYENLKFYAGLFDVPTQNPMKLLEALNLTEAAHRKASAYSKGMRQRLVFARALINNPKMLFLDEPTSGLDPNTAAIVKEIILSKKKEGCTIFLTTHSMAIADDLCDTVAFLNEGKIVAMDTPRNLKLAYGERSVRVEFGDDGKIHEKVFFLDKTDDHKAFSSLVQTQSIQTIHSQEATLEQIFIQLTGRGLT